MKEYKDVWATSNDELVRFLQAPPDNKSDYTNLTVQGLDMAARDWIKLGTAEIQYTFLPTSELYNIGVATIDERLIEMKKEFDAKVEILQNFRATLLCIDAPKDTAQ